MSKDLEQQVERPELPREDEGHVLHVAAFMLNNYGHTHIADDLMRIRARVAAPVTPEQPSREEWLWKDGYLYGPQKKLAVNPDIPERPSPVAQDKQGMPQESDGWVEEDEPPTCARCNAVYSLRDGCDRSKYCDSCAHEMVGELEAKIAALVE